MAELDNPCCTAETQADCCEPGEKADCCGAGDTACGCAPGVGSSANTVETVREAVREKYALAAIGAASEKGPSCGSPADMEGGFGSALYAESGEGVFLRRLSARRWDVAFRPPWRAYTRARWCSISAPAQEPTS
jgi:hypothetical protein